MGKQTLRCPQTVQISLLLVPRGLDTVYTLTFMGLNFRGSQILVIFVFLFSRMQGLSL